MSPLSQYGIQYLYSSLPLLTSGGDGKCLRCAVRQTSDVFETVSGPPRSYPEVPPSATLPEIPPLPSQFNSCVSWSPSDMPVLSTNSEKTITYSEDHDCFIILERAEPSALRSVLVSNTSVSWQARSLPLSNYVWNKVVFGKSDQSPFHSIGIGVARGIGALADAPNSVMTSNGGLTWGTLLMPTSRMWRGLAFGNNRFVAVAQQGDTAIYDISSPVLASEFSASAILSNPGLGWYDVAFGNGRFVAVCFNSSTSAYSSNGSSWSFSSLPESTSWRKIAFGNGRFFASGGVGPFTKVVTSVDGINWSYVTSYPPLGNGVNITDMVYSADRGQWVFIHDNGNDFLWDTAYISDDDGTTWTATTMPSASDWGAVAAGKTTTDPSNDAFFAVTYNSASGAILACPPLNS